MTPIFSLENLHRQYLRCRRNKRNTLNALRFEYHLEENLVKLQQELAGQTYEPSRSVCFVLKQPKLREIFAADFRDRVVHHVLVDALEKVWEPLFIHDSYACRKGKGTHRAVRRLQAFMRKVSCNGTRRAHFIHLDVRGFFLHINKEILHQILARRIRDARVLGLARTVIFHGWREEIREFLQSRLRLTLNERRQCQGPIGNGVDFLGYIVRPDYLLVRRRVVNRLKGRLRAYERRLVARREKCTTFRYDRPVLAALRATWASYAAHLKMAHTHRLREALWNRFGWLREFLQPRDGDLARVDAASTGFRGLRGQYRFFCRQYPGSLPVFQVGRFFEFYDEHAERAGWVLGLRMVGPGRGSQSRCGFPMRLQHTYLRRLMGLGCPVHVVREEGEWLGGVKMRRLAERWMPLPGPVPGEGA